MSLESTGIFGMVPSLDRLKMSLDIVERTMPNWIRLPYSFSLGWGKTIASLGLNRHLSIYQLDMGREQSEATIGYLGPGHNLDFIASLVYKDVPELQSKNHVTLPKIQSVVRHMRTEYDIVIVELPYRILQRLVWPHGFLTMPWVNWYLNIQQSWEEIKKGFHKDALENLRKMEGIECIKTHQPADFEDFYHRIYHPFIKRRFGTLAQPPSHDLMQYCFKRGWLALYLKDGQVLGGGVNYTTAGILHNHALGFRSGISRKERSQISTARHYYSIQAALEAKCDILNLAQTRPLLSDGLARYKRKWGGYVLPDSSQNWGFWIGPGRDLARARHFLSKHAWIWFDQANRPSGLIVDDSDNLLGVGEVEKACRRFWNPGLHSIILCASGGFEEGVDLGLGPLPNLGPATTWKKDG